MQTCGRASKGQAAMPHVAMPRPPLSHSRTSSVCVASISTGSSAWRRGTRHSGPPHPLTGVVGGPEAWSNAAAPSAPPRAQPAPLCTSRGQARTARAPSCQWCPLSSSFFHEEEDLISAQDKDIDLVSKRTFISKLRPQKQKLPLPDLCHSHWIIPQPPQ